MSQLPSENKSLEVATLAGGCFWCTEAAFSIMKGVERSLRPGYTGGISTRPFLRGGFYGQHGAC